MFLTWTPILTSFVNVIGFSCNCINFPTFSLFKCITCIILSHSVEKKIDHSRKAAFIMRWQREGVIVPQSLF